MEPDEVNGVQVRIAARVRSVEPGPDVEALAGNAKLLADVAAGATAGHWIQRLLRVEEREEIADQVTAAITGIFRVAIGPTLESRVDARERRDRACGLGCERKLDQTSMVR